MILGQSRRYLCFILDDVVPWEPPIITAWTTLSPKATTLGLPLLVFEGLRTCCRGLLKECIVLSWGCAISKTILIRLVSLIYLTWNRHQCRQRSNVSAFQIGRPCCDRSIPDVFSHACSNDFPKGTQKLHMVAVDSNGLMPLNIQIGYFLALTISGVLCKRWKTISLNAHRKTPQQRKSLSRKKN